MELTEGVIVALLGFFGLVLTGLGRGVWTVVRYLLDQSRQQADRTIAVKDQEINGQRLRADGAEAAAARRDSEIARQAAEITELRRLLYGREGGRS